MLIKRITVNDWKRYVGTHSFTFFKINLISGENGAGKTSIALHPILFAIYGYSDNTLSNLHPRGLVNPTTWVEVELVHLNKTYIIKRFYPTKLLVYIDGVELKLANNQLKQAELEKIFYNVEYFRKFRMVDIIAGVNILEQGQANLRKTLVNFDNMIDLSNVRKSLLDKKSIREQFNKDTSVLYRHFPSEDRRNALEYKLQTINSSIAEQDKEISENESYVYDLSNKIGRLSAQKNGLAQQKNKLLSTNCPTCGQAVKINKQKELLEQVNRDIVSINENMITLQEDMNLQKEIVSNLKASKQNMLKGKDRVVRLMQRLEARLKQKDYIWTNADVEIMKQAIKEVDGFSTYYITEKLKNLEPLINNILNKVGFSIKFNVDDKNNFDIKITNKGQQYVYSELSNGERLLITTAFQLALLMEKNETGIVIADEGFSSLSDKNLNLIMDLFINSPFQLVAIVHRYTSTDLNVNNIKI